MILDHVEDLNIAIDEEDYLFDAKMTLARISQGLFWLHNSVKRAERAARKAAQKDNVLISFIKGPLENLRTDWLSCAFQWYAVSLYNYVRLVGWLATREEKFVGEYVKRVIPRITNYRHKVAAHFAMTSPRGDNEADLMASIMTNIVYAHGFLRAGAVSEVIVDAEGNEIRPSTKTSWSMTKVHKSLIPRYWPDGPLRAHSSIKISAGATRRIFIDWED